MSSHYTVSSPELARVEVDPNLATGGVLYVEDRGYWTSVYVLSGGAELGDQRPVYHFVDAPSRGEALTAAIKLLRAHDEMHRSGNIPAMPCYEGPSESDLVAMSAAVGAVIDGRPITELTDEELTAAEDAIEAPGTIADMTPEQYATLRAIRGEQTRRYHVRRAAEAIEVAAGPSVW